MSPPLSSPRGHRRTLRRRADDNVAIVSYGQHVLTPTAAAAWRANTAVSKAAWWPWPFDLESVVQVTCDVGYLCANLSLPRPLCSRLRPDVRNRQTDVRQKHRLISTPIRGGGITSSWRPSALLDLSTSIYHLRRLIHYLYIVNLESTCLRRDGLSALKSLLKIHF